MYDLSVGGFKPFGALGQGSANNLNVDLDKKNKGRVMLVTLIPVNPALV